MSRLMILLMLFGLAACGVPTQTLVPNAQRPMRIVSLDYCADQYVLKLADRDQILALSPEAARDYSYMHEAAAGLPTVRPVTEDVLILKPDLIVRSYGGGPNAEAFFERTGIPVLTVGWTTHIDSEESGSIPSIIQQMADGLGQSERGRELVSEFRARLTAIEKHSDGKTALYMTPAGVTSGPGSMIHEMLASAGFKNFEREPGWRALPLERLAYEQPDVIAAAFFDRPGPAPDSWSAMKHPVAKQQMEGRPVVHLQGAWTSCSAWFMIDAIEALAEGGEL